MTIAEIAVALVFMLVAASILYAVAIQGRVLAVMGRTIGRSIRNWVRGRNS